MDDELIRRIIRLPRAEAAVPPDSRVRLNTIRHRRLGAGLAEIARQMSAEGCDNTQIWCRLRGMGVSRDLIRRWCNGGRSYSSAIPGGFVPGLRRHRLSGTERISQLSNAVVCEARVMAMDGVAPLVIQDFLNELPDLLSMISGIGPDRWAKSDLFRILFTPFPAGHRSLPRGYRRWLKAEGAALKKRVLDLEATAKGHTDRCLTSEEIEFLAGTSLVGVPGPAVVVDDFADHLGWDGRSLLQPDELDRALRRHDERASDPFHWAGMIVNGRGVHTDAREALGCSPQKFRRWADVDALCACAGCSRREARRALSAIWNEAA